ncbi:hypothetical protein NDU88_000146 [Pleurodeles waltl]|uniref:Uncharacterized protein n=2 Tax=Pleurodeles waltl TaxID=8319 RepID=A0AAV7V7K6_PLEWA|nr:hypothetical protein NDU88_000146 [Pleurodeles waltl]
MQSGVGRKGLTSTKLGLKSHWTVGVTGTELLDSRDLADRAERRPRGPERQGLETSPLEDGSPTPWRVVQKCFPAGWTPTSLATRKSCVWRFFGRCWGPGGTRRSQIGPEERGDVEQDKEPSLKQVAPGEVPETGTTRMRETVLAEVAQRSPTSPETNLESRAMQVRVPWTQAWLCTKDFRRKCTGAGVACKVAVPSNAAQRGEARTYLHQTWAEESLDCGGHLDSVAGFEGPRSSC